MKSCEQQYILTQDTTRLLELVGSTSGLEPAIGSYLNELKTILENAFQQEKQLVVQAFTEEEIDSQLGTVVQSRLNSDPNAVILCIDRFLLSSTEENYPCRFQRVSTTRKVDGTRGPRPQSQSINIQMDSIASKFQKANFILVDDGVFSGGTIKEVISNLTAAGINANQIKETIGYIGSESKSLIENVPVTILNPINNLFEWIDIRDFAPWGGKQIELTADGSTAYSIPYIFPWSYGDSASLDRLGSFFKLSKQMITSYDRLVSTWEEMNNQTLWFDDFKRAGIPIPSSETMLLRPMPLESVGAYLKRCLQCVEAEEQRQVAIFDMDGTLYELVGPQNKYAESVLESRINENAVRFIQTAEQCSIDEAEILVQQGLNDKVGLSNFVNQRYGISRKDYFSNVWNIDPRGVIKNYTESANTIKSLAADGVKCILLTSAPKVWQQQVINLMGLNNTFESVYTGEDFSTKNEVFAMLIERYLPKNILSIGDQYETDIQPAAQLGMNTLIVTTPQQITEYVRSL